MKFSTINIEFKQLCELCEFSLCQLRYHNRGPTGRPFGCQRINPQAGKILVVCCIGQTVWGEHKIQKATLNVYENHIILDRC